MEVQPGNKAKAYADMSISELVNAYNSMASSPVGKSCELKPVQSFRDKGTAVRRCTSAEVMIRAASKEDSTSNKVESSRKEPKPKSHMGVREGTYREKLIAAMLKEPPKTAQQLSQAVYGTEDKVGAVKMVMKGIIVAIDKGSLPYKIVRAKSEGGTTYQLIGV